jgi:hypothetical protein
MKQKSRPFLIGFLLPFSPPRRIEPETLFFRHKKKPTISDRLLLPLQSAAAD